MFGPNGRFLYPAFDHFFHDDLLTQRAGNPLRDETRSEVGAASGSAGMDYLSKVPYRSIGR
jgi:hypothetical protein